MLFVIQDVVLRVSFTVYTHFGRKEISVLFQFEDTVLRKVLVYIQAIRSILYVRQLENEK